MSAHLLATKHDISRYWHDKLPGIMGRFVQSFTAPVRVGGDFIGNRRQTVGEIVSVEQRGEDLWGEIRWMGIEPYDRYVKINWASGPGEAASLTSGFLDHWPHRTEWDEDEEDDLDADDDWSPPSDPEPEDWS